MPDHTRIEDINDKGIIIKNNIFNNSEFSQINLEVNKLIKNKNIKNGKIVLVDEELRNSVLFDLYENSKIKQLIKDIFKHTKYKLDISDNYKVLRVLTGKESDKDNKNYHFDGYYLTVMLPIVIPKENDQLNGDFLIVPNFRYIYKSKTINLIIKFFYQNRLSKLIYKTSLFNKLFKPIKITPRENSLIIFKGFESLHGSEILGKDRTRITMLYHFKKIK